MTDDLQSTHYNLRNTLLHIESDGDLAPLAMFRDLRELDVNGTKIVNFSVIKKLTCLEILNLNYTVTCHPKILPF